VPTVGAAHSRRCNIAGCKTNMPTHSTWDSCISDAAFFRDTASNSTTLGGLVPLAMATRRKD
tara:strand:- start:134 stop:319 length:186 start_codon:yes stop_codon:yes gene_type:complete